MYYYLWCSWILLESIQQILFTRPPVFHSPLSPSPHTPLPASILTTVFLHNTGDRKVKQMKQVYVRFCSGQTVEINLVLANLFLFSLSGPWAVGPGLYISCQGPLFISHYGSLWPRRTAFSNLSSLIWDSAPDLCLCCRLSTCLTS